MHGRVRGDFAGGRFAPQLAIAAVLVLCLAHQQRRTCEHASHRMPDLSLIQRALIAHNSALALLQRLLYVKVSQHPGREAARRLLAIMLHASS